MFALVLLLAILAVLVAYGVMVYNGLVSVKHAVAKAWANIDVLLKQRHDEIPKLVEVCRRYRNFEQRTLENVVRARSAVHAAREKRDIAALGAAEQVLRGSLGSLFAVAEAYPDLKTNESFLKLQARISDLENGIADRREVYNEAVNVNNVRIEQFPDVVIAKMFDFPPARLLQFSAAEKADVDMRALFAA
jgi:LemA protein